MESLTSGKYTYGRVEIAVQVGIGRIFDSTVEQNHQTLLTGTSSQINDKLHM